MEIVILRHGKPEIPASEKLRACEIMARVVMLISIAIFGFYNIAFANIRAAYRNEFKGSTGIRTSIPNLTVMKEELIFECDAPYRGKIVDVENQIREVRTSATYLVLSKNETDAKFDFILTVKQPAKAFINGIVSNVSAPIELTRYAHDIKSLLNRNDGSYKVSFSGRLKKGLNTINVSYSQPMSAYEKMGGIYPFIYTSAFRSAFTYDLSPLREWNMDDAFTMNIRIAFKDDSGWLKRVFGSKYKTHVYRVTKNEHTYHGKKDTEIPFLTNKKAPNEMTEIFIQFKKDFPDMLEATFEY